MASEIVCQDIVLSGVSGAKPRTVRSLMNRSRIIIARGVVYDEASLKGDMFDCEVASRGLARESGLAKSSP